MEDWLPLAAALPFVVLLLLSGAWASRRFARFDELPAHFDFAGRATRMTSRRVMVWMLPVLFSLVLLAIGISTVLLPREIQNGDPAIGALIGGVGLLGAQLFVLWLTDRWARAQDGA